MDKHMIHIDDLVRQRLDGAEDPEIPGGWLRMKELLDKEMPVQTGVGWGRRRIIGYFAGLLLLTTAGVGGFRYYSSNQPGIYLSGGSEEIESNVTPEVISLSMPARDARSAKAESHSNSSFVSNNGGVVGSGGKQSTAGSASGHGSANNSGSNHRINRNSNHNNDLANAGGTPNNIADVSKSNKNNNGSGADNINRAQTTDPVLANNAATSNYAHQTSFQEPAPVVNTSEGMTLTSLPMQHLSSGSAHLLPAASSTTKAMPAPLPVKYRFETIETIEIVHHRVYDATSQKSVFRIDTLPKGKVLIAKAVPQPEMVTEPRQGKDGVAGIKSPKPSKSTGKSRATGDASPAIAAAASKSENTASAEPVPQSSVPGLLAKTEDAGSANQSAGKSSGSKFQLWNAEKFEEAVNKFKMNLARMQIYPGVMGGINASIFTPNALGGFQMGLTSLVVLNDWWTLVGELKYIHRFNTGSTVHDDYTSVVPGSGSTTFVTYNNKDYKAYEWKDQSVEHYFNFDVVQTLEMPVALRYSWGRVYAMGGVNMVYSLPIQASEVTHLKGDTVAHRDLRPASHDDEKFIQDDAPLVKLSDFGPRFGLGYLLGGGFMFTPSVYMDLRVTQTFWDNSSGEGAKQISRDLLRTPSVQLSVGYRFGQKPH